MNDVECVDPIFQKCNLSKQWQKLSTNTKCGFSLISTFQRSIFELNNYLFWSAICNYFIKRLINGFSYWAHINLNWSANCSAFVMFEFLATTLHNWNFKFPFPNVFLIEIMLKNEECSTCYSMKVVEDILNLSHQ